MVICLPISDLSAIIYIGVFFNIISPQKARKFIRVNKILIVILIILVLSGAFQIKLNCP